MICLHLVIGDDHQLHDYHFQRLLHICIDPHHNHQVQTEGGFM